MILFDKGLTHERATIDEKLFGVGFWARKNYPSKEVIGSNDNCANSAQF
jgi:hypothetical protein